MGLGESPVVVRAYHAYVRSRYRGRWESPVAFRGARFVIGRDLSLFPSVAHGGFEAEEIDTLLPLVSGNEMIWDVGANVGLYTVLLAQAAPRGHVVAFEPVPESRARLIKNLDINGVRNATVQAIALSDHAGEARMQVYEDGHGCDHLVRGDTHEVNPANLTVVTATGDEYASLSGDPDIVKVDIEGHEPEFLRGSWEMLVRRRPILMLEVNPATWRQNDRLPVWSAILDELLDLYAGGEWFDAGCRRRVTHVDVEALRPRVYTLLLTRQT